MKDRVKMEDEKSIESEREEEKVKFCRKTKLFKVFRATFVTNNCGIFS